MESTNINEYHRSLYTIIKKNPFLLNDDIDGNKIIYIKYLISKCNPLVYQVIKKILLSSNSFSIKFDYDFEYTEFGIRDITTYMIVDKDTNLSLEFSDERENYNIFIIGNKPHVLSDDENSHFLILLCLQIFYYIKDNIKELETNNEKRNLIEKYMKQYT